MLTAEEAYNKTNYNIECKICEFLNPIIIEETMRGEFGVCISIEYLIEKIKCIEFNYEKGIFRIMNKYGYTCSFDIHNKYFYIDWNKEE